MNEAVTARDEAEAARADAEAGPAAKKAHDHAAWHNKELNRIKLENRKLVSKEKSTDYWKKLWKNRFVGIAGPSEAAKVLREGTAVLGRALARRRGR